MADIARLLLGGDQDETDSLLAAECVHNERLGQAGEWCQTPPDLAAIRRLAATLRARQRR